MSTDPKQPAGKYMDVTHPAHVRPSATSRPIIVGNRTMLVADPMISESADRAVTARKADPDSSLVDAETQSERKNIEPPVGLSSAPNLPPKQPEEANPKTDATASAATDPGDATVAAPPELGGAIKSETQSKPETPAKEATEPHKESTADIHESPAPDTAVQTTPVIDTTTEESDAPNPEDEAAAHSEQIIAQGTYFLPIGQAKHRGQRIVFGLCLIVVLSIAILDVLLDIGIISLSGIPHTTFFGS